MNQTQELLERRYGGSSKVSKPMVIVIVSIVASIFFGFAIYASFIGKPLASVEVTSYKKLDEHQIQANFTALTGEKTAACVFKAYTAAGSVVGFAEVSIPANNPDTKALSVVVKTIEGASVLRSDGCSVK